MHDLRRYLTAVFLLFALCHGYCETAAADEAPRASGLTGSVIAGGTSDYVYRGISLTAGRPTPFLFGEIANGPIRVSGLLIGNDLGEDALGRSIGNLEADATVAWTPSLGNVDFNFGAKYTGYPNGRDIVVGTLTPAERDFIECFAGAKVNIDDATSLGVTGYLTPNFYYQTGHVDTLEVQGARVLPPLANVQPRFTATVGVVHSANKDAAAPGNGYLYYNAGIEGQIEHVYFDLRYWGTDVRDIDSYGRRLVLTVGLKFP